MRDVGSLGCASVDVWSVGWTLGGVWKRDSCVRHTTKRQATKTASGIGRNDQRQRLDVCPCGDSPVHERIGAIEDVFATTKLGSRYALTSQRNPFSLADTMSATTEVRGQSLDMYATRHAAEGHELRVDAGDTAKPVSSHNKTSSDCSTRTRHPRGPLHPKPAATNRTPRAPSPGQPTEKKTQATPCTPSVPARTPASPQPLVPPPPPRPPRPTPRLGTSRA